MIRECSEGDTERIGAVVNAAAKAYKGVIPVDCWHEPYMALDELRREMGNMRFFGWDDGDGLVGVMGYQPLGEVTLVRHAYVVPERQGEGIGSRLLEHLMGMTAGSFRGRTGREAADGPSRLLVGTWKAATWAMRFYESHGFRRLGHGESQELLKRYWEIPSRQMETSLVLEMGASALAARAFSFPPTRPDMLYK